MTHWSLDDIAWNTFEPGKVTPELLSLVKAASMVEHNGHDYARYLCEVFHDDPTFMEDARLWAEEEVQHGRALRKWAELADPDFNFDESFGAFTTGYQLPVNVDASVRGSRSGELIARCMVEIGTSSYYTAIKDYTEEPVLKALCAKIAADEFRHYKLFYTHLQHYQQKDALTLWKRFKIALGRIVESEDDELAYAFYAAHKDSMQMPYNRKACTKRYMDCTRLFYRKKHVEKMTSMVFKTLGLKPNSWFNDCLNLLVWHVLKPKVSI